MTTIEHDLQLLVSIARIDVTARDHRAELARIPPLVADADRKIAVLKERETTEVDRFETMKKEKRHIETELQDHENKLNHSKNKLADVKTNQEYTAALKEIDRLKLEIDAREERLLELMEHFEGHEAGHRDTLAAIAKDCVEAEQKRTVLAEQQKRLEGELAACTAEKPKYLAELSAPIRKQYERLLGRYRDAAVVPIQGEHCGGCGTAVRPQLAVEVRKNTQLIGCEACGRMLVSYDG